MRKTLSILLVLALCFGLCACVGNTGNSADSTDNATAPVATIKTRDGETVYLTSAELCTIYNENQAKYSSKYQTADATIIGTVKSIEEHQEYFGSIRKKVYDINLVEGWEITVLAECHKEVIDLSAGDKVKISSELQLARYNIVSLQSIGNNSSGWYDETVIEMVE